MLHIIKLCVGADTITDLTDWVRRRSAENKAAGRRALHEHVTRMHPRRKDEILDGGSLYWVIKGMVMARQEFAALESRTGADGIERCVFLLKPKVHLTEPTPRRAFQGWRYLQAEDAPRDLTKARAGGTPPALRRELAELGLL